MTKDIFNRIKNKRKLAPRGIELEDQLPRVTDIFTKQAEVLFPAEPRPYVAPKDPLEILKEKFSVSEIETPQRLKTEIKNEGFSHSFAFIGNFDNSDFSEYALTDKI